MRLFLKTIGVIVLAIIGLITVLYLFENVLGTRSDIISGVTGKKIKQVKPGMTIEQVISILGKPYKVEALKGLHQMGCAKPNSRLNMDITNETDIKAEVNKIYNDTNYCCDGNREDKQTKEITLTYSRPVKFSKYYPMLWVHLDSNYNVFGVYAKRYEGFLGLDDPSIYSSYWETIVDTVTGDLHFTDKIDLHIDEQKFAECFK